MTRKIGLIGPGKLGLCVGLLLEKAHYQIIAIEKNPDYLDQLKSNSLDSSEPEVNGLFKDSKIKFSDDLNSLFDSELDAIMIYVPTPENDRGYDHTILEGVLDELCDISSQEKEIPVLIGCTTLPGFCETYTSKLENHNFSLVYSPSFIAQGSIIQNLKNPDILLFGSHSETSSRALEHIIIEMTKNDTKVHHMDPTSAEITKLATNCFLTAKISFANAIGDIALESGADPNAILNAIGADQRIGKKYLGYGFGFGGPCFPRDNRALNYYAKNLGYPLQISAATDAANKQHTEYQVTHFLRQYPDKETIHFDHVTYKPNSDILQDSQQLEVAAQLAKKGRKVSVSGSSKLISLLKQRFKDLFLYNENSP